MRSFLIFIAVTVAVAAVGGLSAPGTWYAGLLKPAWTPPGWVFGAVWAVLYPCIALAGWRLWRAATSPERTISLWLWGVQLALNGAWSPVFFGAQQPVIALAIILALLAVIAASFGWFRSVSGLAVGLYVPYALWIGLATALNAAIVALN